MATPPRQERRRLVDLLVGAGLLDRADVPRAMALVKQTGGHLLRVIVDEGWVDEDRLIRALSSALGVEAVTPATMKIHERVLSLVPARLAIRYRALPIAIKRANQTDYLYVAIGDPLDLEAIDDIQRASGCRINVLIAPPTQLDAAIARHYGAPQETPSGGMPLPSASALDRRRPGPSSPPAPLLSRTPAPYGSPRPADPRGSDPRGATTVSGPPSGLPAPTGSMPGVTSGIGLPAPLGMPNPPTTPGSGVRSQSVAQSAAGRSARSSAVLPPASVPPAPTLRAPLAPPPATTGRSALQSPALPSFPAVDEAWSRSAGFRPPDTHDAKTQLDTSLLEITGDAPRGQDTVRGIPSFARPEPAMMLAPRPSEPPPRAPVPRSSASPAELSPRLEPVDLAGSDEPGWDVEIDEAPESDGAGLRSSAGLQLVRGVPTDADDDHPVELQEVVSESGDLEPATSEFDLGSTGEPDFVAALEAAVSDDLSARPTALLSATPRELPRELPGVGSHLPTAIGPAPSAKLPTLPPGAGPFAAPTPPSTPTSIPASIPASMVARTMEVPVSPDDVPSPFDGLRDASVRAGLELTGIIPALDWEAEGFDPPITRGAASPALAGSDDIPSSPSAVRARLEPLLDEAASAADEPRRAVEEVRERRAEERRAEDARRAEELRKGEERRLEDKRADDKLAADARRAEDKRAAEEARRTEDKRVAEEARRAEEKRAEERRAEEKRLAEEARKAEEKRLEERRAEEKRFEERRAEEARRAEEKRVADEARRVEERRLADEARRAEERRLEERRAEERRLEERRAEERRLEERRLEERRAEERRAEERRQAEERRLEEVRRAQRAAADEETQARTETPSPTVDGALVEEVAAPATDPRRPAPEEPITNPRMAAAFNPLPVPVAMDVDVPVEKPVGPWEVTPANDRLPTFATPPLQPAVVDPVAQQLVGALVAGRSLNTAQRAQVLLALGRVLIAKGIITADELALALSTEGEAG